MPSPAATRVVLVLAALLSLTLGLKYAVLARRSEPDIEALQSDIARMVAATGYRIERSRAPVVRFDAVRGRCRAIIAVALHDGSNLDFLRQLAATTFPHRGEFIGGQLAAKAPVSHLVAHYASRTLAMFGVDRPAEAYVLTGWDAACPAPSTNFAGLWVHYRRVKPT